MFVCTIFDMLDLTSTQVNNLNGSTCRNFFFFFLGFVFLYILDVDSMNEENDEYSDIVSSAPKIMRSRTSSICLDFEILPKGPHGKERERSVKNVKILFYRC